MMLRVNRLRVSRHLLRAFVIELVVILFLNPPAGAANADKAVCSRILTTAQPASDTQTFINIIRAIAEKNAFTSSELADLANAQEPLNPVSRATRLTPEVAYSFSKVFDRLLARKQLNWHLIRADLRKLLGEKTEREENRSDTEKNTKNAPAVVAIDETIATGLASTANAEPRSVFTSRDGRSFFYFELYNPDRLFFEGWQVDLQTGKAHHLKSDRYLDPTYFETASGQVLATYSDSKGAYVYDAESGAPAGDISFWSVESLRGIAQRELRSVSIHMSQRANTGAVEMLVVPNYRHHDRATRMSHYVDPVVFDLKTKHAHPLGQPSGDYRYTSDTNGHILSYGTIETDNQTELVVRDLSVSIEPIFSRNISTRAELFQPFSIYRSSKTGNIHVATHDTEAKVVRIYSNEVLKPREVPFVGSNEVQTFFEDPLGKVYYLLGDRDGSFLKMSATDETATALKPPMALKDTAAWITLKQFRTVPGMGVVLVYEQYSLLTEEVVIAFYNLLTEDLIKVEPVKIGKVTPLTGAYVTKEGQVRSVYKDQRTLKLFQLFGPLK